MVALGFKPRQSGACTQHLTKLICLLWWRKLNMNLRWSEEEVGPNVRFCTGNPSKELCSFSHTRHSRAAVDPAFSISLTCSHSSICSSPCSLWEGLIPHPDCEASDGDQEKDQTRPPACSWLHKVPGRFRVFIRFLHQPWAWVRIPIREPSISTWGETVVLLAPRFIGDTSSFLFNLLFFFFLDQWV